MIMNRIHIVITLVSLLFASCREKQWDERGKSNFEGGDANLLEALQANPALSKFHDAIVQTGYDNLLSSGGSFTVLAPTNDAWNPQTDDMESLIKMVGNHIAYDKRLTTDEKLKKELFLVTGKMIRYDENASFGIGGAQITSGDHAASNGVFHIMDKMVILQLNIWEHIVDNLAKDYAQAAFLKTDLVDSVIDLKRSVRTGVHPQTGAPIYDTVFMAINSFLDAVPLNDEMKVFTYVVMHDDGFNYLSNKFRPFFHRKTDKGTDSLSRFNVCKDMVFDGIVDISAHDTLTNIFGYKVALDGNVSEEPYLATNGRVYLISRSNIKYKERFRPVLIDASDYLYSNVFSTANNNRLHRTPKSWANGSGNIIEHRMNLYQRDTLKSASGIPVRCLRADSDSTRVVLWYWGTTEANNFSPESRRVNGYVEYRAELYSGQYEICYKAFLEEGSGFRLSGDPPTAWWPNAVIKQKFFISMPDAPRLRHGNGGSSPPAAHTRPDDIASIIPQTNVWSVNAIENNFLGPDTAFVAVDTVFIEKENKMRKHRLIFTDPFQFNVTYNPETPQRIRLPQYVQNRVPEPDSHILKVPRAGELTMWLTNSASNDDNTTTDFQNKGPIIMDYIKFVPILPDED